MQGTQVARFVWPVHHGPTLNEQDADPDNDHCQLLGTSQLRLEHVNSKDPFPHMSENCPSVGPACTTRFVLSQRRQWAAPFLIVCFTRRSPPRKLLNVRRPPFMSAYKESPVCLSGISVIGGRAPCRFVWTVSVTG